jgi:hypothetical protein
MAKHPYHDTFPSASRLTSAYENAVSVLRDPNISLADAAAAIQAAGAAKGYSSTVQDDDGSITGTFTTTGSRMNGA